MIGPPEEPIPRKLFRLNEGLIPLVLYGALGTVEQYIIAPSQGQIPLVGGFTLVTPWSGPEVHYRRGVPGQSQDFQWEAHLAGQDVDPFGLIRSHTTGLIDYGTRHGWPFADKANEFVHPGHVEIIVNEFRQPR